MAVVGRGGPVRLALDEGEDRGRIDEDQRAERPGERLLDVRLGVTDQRRR